MPNLTWQEISDLKHLVENIKKHKDKYSKYVDGLVEMTEGIINSHDNEET